MDASRGTIAVGMSGGVDSSVAAALLTQQGYRAVGLTMLVYGGGRGAPTGGHACYGPGEEEDVRVAREVARALGIQHHSVDLREEYRRWVLDHVESEYLRGRTPNPCVRCNPLLKFGFLLDRARRANIAFDRFATGHYVRVSRSDAHGGHVLQRGRDLRKDQSYFLHGLPRRLLSELVFPLGELTKAEVRRRAEELGWPVSERPESQDFMGGGGYATLFAAEQTTPGPVVHVDGRRLGTHRGLVRYTIGQRRGLGLCHAHRLHVVRIDAEHNTLVVGDRDAVRTTDLVAEHINWVSIDPPTVARRVQAKIRYQQPGDDAELVPLDETTARAVFDRPQWAITPGQSVVFYDGDVLLGGGVIELP